MKNTLALICQSSSIDIRTNQISIFNILEGLSFVRPKDKEKEDHFIAPIPFQLVSFWVCKDEKDRSDIKVKILDPTNQMITEIDGVIHSVDGKLKIRNIVDFASFKVTKPGTYNVVLMSGNKAQNDFKVITEIPIDIKVEYKDQNKKNNP